MPAAPRRPEPVLPPPEQWAALAPGPGSLTRRFGGDARLLLVAGSSLLLQVAHPTVGAGVHEHSTFTADPWARLARTLDFVAVMSYGGPRAAGEMGRRIRGYHRQITGRLADGRRYHALEPEAYAWVHATLAWGVVTCGSRFARPLGGHEREAFWQEWRRAGRLLGVRPRDLPATWAAVGPYMDDMIARRLVRTLAVEDVLQALSRPRSPATGVLPALAWPLARPGASRLFALATTGTLPPQARRRLGIGWSGRQELEFRALSAAMRGVTPALPAGVRCAGPAYLRWRHEAIARGDVARARAFPAHAA